MLLFVAPNKYLLHSITMKKLIILKIMLLLCPITMLIGDIYTTKLVLGDNINKSTDFNAIIQIFNLNWAQFQYFLMVEFASILILGGYYIYQFDKTFLLERMNNMFKFKFTSKSQYGREMADMKKGILVFAFLIPIALGIAHLHGAINNFMIYNYKSHVCETLYDISERYVLFVHLGKNFIVSWGIVYILMFGIGYYLLRYFEKIKISAK